jgi:hypothetical protein
MTKAIIIIMAITSISMGYVLVKSIKNIDNMTKKATTYQNYKTKLYYC